MSVADLKPMREVAADPPPRGARRTGLTFAVVGLGTMVVSLLEVLALGRLGGIAAVAVGAATCALGIFRLMQVRAQK